MTENSEELRVNIGRKVKELRARAGMQQSVLAQRLGVDKSYISKIEAGKVLPSIQTLIGMRYLFKVSIDAIVSGEGKSLLDRHPQLVEMLEEMFRDEVLMHRAMAELLQLRSVRRIELERLEMAKALDRKVGDRSI